ncbi:MAG: hypothetical protein LBI84_07470 [Propionibacteriaceae bacterium]|jgi:hypothetical protein|nr:hypothetical protein [Propionibacteriaceae bacterium]
MTGHAINLEGRAPVYFATGAVQTAAVEVTTTTGTLAHATVDGQRTDLWWDHAAALPTLAGLGGNPSYP